MLFFLIIITVVKTTYFQKQLKLYLKINSMSYDLVYGSHCTFSKKFLIAVK